MAHANSFTWVGRQQTLYGDTAPGWIAWGNSSVTGSAKSDIALFAQTNDPMSSSTLTYWATTNWLADTLVMSGIMTSTQNNTITEMGFFSANNPLPSAFVNSSGINATSTTLGLSAPGTLDAGSNTYYCQLENEIILVQSGGGTSTLTIIRGRLGSTAAIHPANAMVTEGQVIMTSGGIEVPNTSVYEVTGPPSGTYNYLYFHYDFPAINVCNNDAIAFTCKVIFE